ncbi:hypothetical protein UPYG_G00266360 [Umbra pygmaea]|uniref:Leucine-rich repeat-containing protein 56 n=1 Tax=Umbra pygmaea TaxID=75934 RepID=A0ABD0WA99_UMBPY
MFKAFVQFCDLGETNKFTKGSGVMNCFQDLVPLVKPGTPRVLVTELSGSGQVNPSPAANEESGMMVELYLSPEVLKALSGTEDLSSVTSLEMCVDTRENSLGSFGAYLPKLAQLKLNNSMIPSVRDLGTTLANLQVLWMSRCSLTHLDGIPSLSSLKELYVAYNTVSDLSPLSMLDYLELLDLEGNDVNDLGQIQYLGLCSQLHTLTLEGNPVCVCPHPNANQGKGEEGYCYRSAVRELVPHLCYLDDMCAKDEAGPSCSSSIGEDWALLRQSIKDCSSAETAEEEARECGYSRPLSSRRSASSLSSSCSSSRPVSARPFSAANSRPHFGSKPLSVFGSRTVSPPGSRSGSADTDPSAVDPDASFLTHGAGKILFCGNPAKVLRARRLKSAAPSPVSTPSAAPLHVPEHTYDIEEQDERQRTDVFSELRAWKEQHHKRLLAMEKEGPQVLTVVYSDEGDDDRGNRASLGIFSGEDEEELEIQGDSSSQRMNTRSPDSSVQSRSPDAFQREFRSPEMAHPSPCPDSSGTLPHPQSATPSSGSRGLSVLRSRRLRPIGLVAGPPVSPSKDHTEPEQTRGDPGFGNQQLQEAVRPQVPMLPQALHHMPQRPASSPLVRRLRSRAGQASVQSVNGHQPGILCRPPERQAIMRPHTASAENTTATQSRPPRGALN